MADSTVTIDIDANNLTTAAIRGAIDNLQKLQDKTTSMTKSLAKFTATAAAMASALGPLTSGLLAAAKAAAAFGKSLAGMSALAAFLPSLVASFKLITLTLKLAGPGLRSALEPIPRFFHNADGSATAFTKRLQTLISAGVRPLAADFAKVNLPVIGKAMDRIAIATNGVVVGVGKWINSVEGQSVIKTISEATATNFEKLTPKVTAAAIAVGRLAGRAGDRAITGFADLIGRILDKFTAWADGTSIDDINKALKDLSGWGGKLKDTFGAIRDIGKWMSENQGKVKAFSDAVAAGAIAIGLATGNIPAVIGGAFALILNHWADLKEQFDGAGTWMSTLLQKWQNNAGRIAIAESLMNALRSLRDGFLAATKDIGPRWAEFVTRLKDAWQEWAPLIAAWWNTVGSKIFEAVGRAIGSFLSNMLLFATGMSAAAAQIGEVFRSLIPVVLNFVGIAVNAAAKAFGWAGELGEKLKRAAAEFEEFKNKVNASLNAIQPVKTVTIRTVYLAPGTRGSEGQSDQRTGNSRQAGTSAVNNWRPAQQLAGLFASGGAFAMSGGGGGVRVEAAPVELHSESNVNVSLDGQPFRAMTVRVVNESQRREAWRAKTGRRR